MDIYCPVCREPWDMDTLHDRVKELHPDMPWVVYQTDKPNRVPGHNDPFWYQQFPYEEINKGIVGWYLPDKYQEYYQPIRREFYAKGCEALGTTHYEDSPYMNKDNSAISMIYELADDDLDFAATMIEDAEYMGLLD